jgi:hypothetical protein
MNNLQHLLEKFKHLLKNSADTRQTVIAIINAKTNLSLTEKDIDVRDSIIYVKSHPLTKNEIFMRKNLILQELKSVLGTNAPRDIR